MNPLFAAGLFDNPWIVAVIVIVGALVNWLSKRRQEKSAGPPPGGDEPSPSAGKAPGEFNLEEALRRLMGEAPPPPLLPRTAQGDRPPARSGQTKNLSNQQGKPSRLCAPRLS